MAFNYQTYGSNRICALSSAFLCDLSKDYSALPETGLHLCPGSRPLHLPLDSGPSASPSLHLYVILLSIETYHSTFYYHPRSCLFCAPLYSQTPLKSCVYFLTFCSLFNLLHPIWVLSIPPKLYVYTDESSRKFSLLISTYECHLM